jgi:hypothetical protein
MLQIITNNEDFEALLSKVVQLAVENLPAQPGALKPDIMTGEQVCEKLDITIQTLIKWRQKGKVPFLKIGSAVRYDFNKVVSALEVDIKKGTRS